jgi:hypothetical protein
MNLRDGETGRGLVPRRLTARLGRPGAGAGAAGRAAQRPAAGCDPARSALAAETNDAPTRDAIQFTRYRYKRRQPAPHGTTEAAQQRSYEAAPRPVGELDGQKPPQKAAVPLIDGSSA